MANDTTENGVAGIPAKNLQTIVGLQAGRESIDLELELGRRVDPQSALPEHLQGQSFDADVWMRVKSHPIRNPVLGLKKLDDDAESREIVRQVMAAANEREKEILLHNQARIFREVIGRAIGALGLFMRTPMIPPKWMVDSSENNPDKTTKRRLPWQGLLTTLLTPKYVLMLLAAFLAITTGWSRIQIANLQDAIKSYQTAAAATDDLKVRLADALNSAKSDRESANLEIEKMKLELADVRNSNHQSELQNASLAKGNELLQSQIKTLNDELRDYRDKQSGDIKTIQAKADGLQIELSKTTDALARAQADAKSSKDTKDSLQKLLDDKDKVLDNLTKELESLKQVHERDLNRIGELQKESTLLQFAETCIASVRREADSWGKMDKDKVNDFLSQYDEAKKHIEGH